MLAQQHESLCGAGMAPHDVSFVGFELHKPFDCFIFWVNDQDIMVDALKSPKLAPLDLALVKGDGIALDY